MKGNKGILKGNKGEWSELYVFSKLLAEGRLYQSDIDLNKEENNFYEVLKAYREESSKNIEYERKGEIFIYENREKKPSTVLTIDYFLQNSKILLKGIREGKGKSFAIEDLEEFINQIKINKLTALTSNKSDIKLRIYDNRLAKEVDLGFSIKSLLGSNSTLLNTGAGNNFVFHVNGKLDTSVEEFNKQTYKPGGGISKITARVKKLQNENLHLNFKEVQSRQFWKNLKMVDGDLPDILSYTLLYAYLYREKSLYRISEKLENLDPLNFYGGEESKQKLYEYKLKKLLVECAMGMTSEKIWEGVYDATGGVIIAKKDGDVVCFHIYDFNLFREYLIKNTIIEQPSTGEDEENPGLERTSEGTKKYYYGWLYKEDDQLKFKINLQIRFK